MTIQRGQGRNRPVMSLTAELVALCHRDIPYLADDPDHVAFDSADYDRAATQVLAAWGDGPIWVFAYGSLIWNPAAEPTEQRRCTAHGWHRAFCMEMRRWRGTPEQPGLMMALRRGGTCEGIAQRFDSKDRHGQMVGLLEREIGGPVGLSSLRSIDLTTSAGPMRALCFYAEPAETEGTPERPLEEVASILAVACGHAGSGAEYLFKTVTALRDVDIQDPQLWRLQALVAAEIRKRVARARPLLLS